MQSLARDSGLCNDKSVQYQIIDLPLISQEWFEIHHALHDAYILTSRSSNHGLKTGHRSLPSYIPFSFFGI
jgi:hypothetical protein